MPGVAVMDPTATSDRPLLKSHKHLPKRDVDCPDVAHPVSPERQATVATPAPPLTPPGANQEGIHDHEPTPRKLGSQPESQTGMLTPRRPSKPPTPDVTPPRTHSRRRPPLSHSVHHSASSRADSFQTAQESMTSDGDTETPIRSAQDDSQKHKPAGLPQRQNAPPAPAARLTYTREAPPFAFAEWQKPVDGSPTPLPGKRKQSRKHEYVVKETPKETLDVQRLDASLMREKKLRDRVRDNQEIPESVSLERFREEIGWPTFDGLSQTDDPESRRLSDLSSTSTVSAMIIDSPKRAQRLLRHTEKRNSLRSASSPVTKSPTSTVSNPSSQPRLAHKAARICEQDRRSISSDISFSAKPTTTAPHASVDIIPVIVVPERRSSLKSGPNSYVSSKQSSQRSTQRPPVSSQGSGSIQVPRQRQRTMSDSAPAPSQDQDSRSRPLGRPVIPPRSSSLSAPTSRNNSRAASLTSASLRSHNQAMDLESLKKDGRQPVSTLRHDALGIDMETPNVNDHQPVSPPRHNILAGSTTFDRPVTQPIVKIEDDPQLQSLREPPKMPALTLSSEDVATLRPPSLPFTQWSIPSTSPGPIEIREATAVTLFPHNNRSLLLVDQRVPPFDHFLPPGPQTHSFRAFYEAAEPPSEPHTPEPTFDPSATKFISPLRHPRTPPQPPVTKPLPPLPAPERLERKPSKATSQHVGRRPSVRRPWGGRPRSNSFTTMARSLSMRSAKNRKAGLEMNGQEHPFWRPRGFWEGISTSPPKGNSARQSLQTTEEGVIINNSLGLPQQRITIEGPSAMARRSPEMRRLLHGMSSASHLNAQQC
ncbi:hypothetical protein N7468_005133 [Penicillium chermesinum]|uniref:Uncharacterized protein n=1 Tax=Penicillium chermesinum TaxID=63820 RepID=A0A9W9TMX2_9EURO|nr:uncharacterized protein N7468_005133 [Penicillium chermesinum]KAJ5232177.1 hypothetical protein N7468_005133 [Penicillium chermesinum]